MSYVIIKHYYEAVALDESQISMCKSKEIQDPDWNS